MTPRYSLTQTAERDLDDILRYLADEHGVERALRVYEAFLDAFERLAATPSIGFLRPQLTSASVRFWPVHSFLVISDHASSPLVVLRVVHGARDLERLLADGD